MKGLGEFHPIVSEWFEGRFGKPTEIQEKAWKLISEDRHCLISAATGSGKTLAAFLWGINQLATGVWELGQTRLLYISPLKALNNDIRRNLLEPIQELRERFESEGKDWPGIRVMTRSGDTDQSERRKMLRHPPEILITTPESLNLLLTSRDGQRALLGVQSVILDEIHSVVGSKRGVYLMTGIERLARLSGEFQRIALSATVKPMETVAAYVGGFVDGKARMLEQAKSSVEKHYSISVNFPERGNEREEDEDYWQPVVEDLKALIAENSSTLIFVNSRMLSEKIAHRINLGEPEPIAYSHHGSLSREIRFAVEQRLKNGELKAIVATNSLEMGIDVGALDCVVMVQCPNTISSAVQKVGRAGHQVGATSQAVVYPSHSKDFLESAVLSQSIRERDIESVSPVDAPLDVLAQVIVSMLGVEDWDIDELYRFLKSAYPYRDLSRDAYELVVNMLAGRYSGSRLRELKPRIAVDRASNRVSLRKGALLAFYFSGGVIPDRGYFRLRMAGSGARIGELDEEFVWEASEGDVFTLGVQSWQIEKITHNDVLVRPANSGDMAPPFWRAEQYDRDFHFSKRIGEFLDWANARLDQPDFEDDLRSHYALNEKAASALHRFLLSQRKATGRDLPHRYHVLAELLESGPDKSPGKQLILHTHWGGRVNRPFALALDAAWMETFGHRTEVYVNNDCVVVSLSDEVKLEEVLSLVSHRNLDTYLRKRLEGSGFFGARFREAAGTSLLISKSKAGQRLPLWLSRMKAKKLFESVQKYDDFPLLLEAWRTCLKDDFDLDSLREVLGEMERGEIAVTVTGTKVASPFAADVAWRQINDEYMYATDHPQANGESKLREDLVQTIAFDSENRPTVSLNIIRKFENKRKRLEHGYEPTDALELKEWLRDRIAIPREEWDGFTVSFEFEVATCKRGGRDWIYLPEESEKVKSLFDGDRNASVFIEWFSYWGPVKEEQLRGVFSKVPEDLWNAFLEELESERKIVRGDLVEGAEGRHVCEAENFEVLLRMRRASSRGQFKCLPIEQLPLFLADRQGLITRKSGSEGIEEVLEQLLGFGASIEDWERFVLPSRIENFHPSAVDSLLSEKGICWYGTDRGRVGFCWQDDFELFEAGKAEEGPHENRLLEILSTGGSYSFDKLRELANCSAAELEDSLWRLVWEGQLSNTSFAAARKGVAGQFNLCSKSEEISATHRPKTNILRTRLRRRLPASETYPGVWYRIARSVRIEDSLSSLELAKERARILLGRYGVVFREILERESEGFRWRDVYKALRLLELSGEAVGGRFFEGIMGLQFAGLDALRSLRRELPMRSFYWVGATDPASVCGLALEGLKGSLPRRLASSRLVYRGSELVAAALREGKSLKIYVEEDDEDLPQILDTLGEALGTGTSGLSYFAVENINDEDARTSVYLESLDKVWRLYSDHKQVRVEGLK